jgi:hypothetical protein
MPITTLVVATNTTDITNYSDIIKVKFICHSLYREKLVMNHCHIKYLPYMKCLEVRSNKIRKLPLIPNIIKYLDVRNNRIKSIKFLPFCNGCRSYLYNKLKDESYL